MTMRPEQKKINFNKSNQALIRLTKQGRDFEIIVNPKNAFDYIQQLRHQSEETQKNIDILDIVEIDNIYSDAAKGEKASEDDLMYAFQKTDAVEVAKVILEEGDLQLTQAQRDELAEKKRRYIINFIARNAVDPKTNFPHPPARIENAIEYAKIKVDPFKNVDSQIKDILHRLMEVLPIKVEQVTIAIRIPAEFGAKAYGLIKRFGEITKEEWTGQGSWIGVVAMPAGRQAEFYENIENLTRGRAEVKVLDRSKGF
jgi:ribosome maturation protein SDO1